MLTQDIERWWKTKVLSVGDLEFQKKAIAKITEIVGQKDRTVICDSHNLTLMRQLCTRCFVLNDGRIVFDGNISDAIEYYTGETDNTANADSSIAMLVRIAW